jgi:hypothetical protein
MQTMLTVLIAKERRGGINTRKSFAGLAWICPSSWCFSEALGETIFFCEDEATKEALVEAGAEPWGIYTRAELQVPGGAKPYGTSL